MEYALDKYGCDSCQEGFEDAETLNKHMLKEVSMVAYSKYHIVITLSFFCSTMTTLMGWKSVTFGFARAALLEQLLNNLWVTH